MSFPKYVGSPCPECRKPVRAVYGSAEWHRKNDPRGGYCHCNLKPLISEFKSLDSSTNSNKSTSKESASGDILDVVGDVIVSIFD